MNGIIWHTFFFTLFSLAACGFAVAVVLTSNIVRMAFYLIMSLGATAGLFFLAGADFVGAMQLLIYVGGTLVLLVFGVMLTAQGPFVSMRTSGGDWILAMIVSGSLLAVLLPSVMSVPGWGQADWSADAVVAANQPETPFHTAALAADSPESANAAVPASAQIDAPPSQPPTATRIGMALVGARVDQLENRPQPLRGGMSGYLFPFEIVSVHLLVVLVGAAYLARTKRRAGSTA